MALQFVFGNSGSGKSTWLYQYVIEQSKKEPERNFLIIVPEQFTMQTQRELVELHPAKAIMNIDVLSFNRLAYRVFDDLGISDFTVLEETGKNLILRKVAEERVASLKIFKGNLKKMGYISEIKSLISELTQYQVSTETLQELSEEKGFSSSFSYKLKDILTMYQGFKEQMEGTYITAEEILELLISVADRSELIKDSVLILDGFTGFTPIQNSLLTEIFPRVKEIKVAVTMDEGEDPFRKPQIQELFYMSKKMVQGLLKIADDTKTEIISPVQLGNGKEKRYKDAGAIFHLEQNLFRQNRRSFHGKQEEIRIFELKNPKEELSFVAAKIHSLVREEGFRYKEIAVVSGDVETYANYAGEVFAKYHVPVFVDTKKSIMFHPLTECIRAVLEVIEEDFSYESVFHYLRTGLSGISEEQTDLLENYVLALGIRGKKWRDKWVVLPGNWKEDLLPELEALREQISSEFAPLREAFHAKSDVRSVTKALYEFLVLHHMEEQMMTYSSAFEQQGDADKAKEYEQIYGVVMDLLDKLVELLGEEILTVKEYGEILNAGFEAAKIGVIPPGYDRVILGDIERTRLEHIRVLFFIGVNDGIIPKSEASGGIISDLEREKFAEHQVELAPSAREKSFIQKFYLYLTMTKPEKRLYLSYTRTNPAGKAVRCSYLIGTIRKIFPDIAVEEPEKTPEIMIETPESGMDYLIQGIEAGVKGQGKELWYALYRWYRIEEAYKKTAEELLNAARKKHAKEWISGEAAKALYGTVLENSVTRLERFAACAFSHFLTYGLGLKERELREFKPVDMGNIFHQALEEYAKLLADSRDDWFTVTEEKRKELTEKAFSDALLKFGNEGLYDTAASEFAAERMKQILDRSLWALTEQVRHGSFIPDAYEVTFGHSGSLNAAEFVLSEEERMHLSGRIDRVDLLKTDSDIYVKVIDYKSGSTKYDLLAVYHGLQLQLVVYLNAAMEVMEKKNPGKKAHPAGIFYYHLDDPFVEGDLSVTEEDVWKELLKELKPDGVVNEKEEVIDAMDQGFSGASSVIPVTKKKDGTFDRRSNVMPEEDFAAMSSYANKKILELGQDIMKGDVEAAPYKLGKKDGCAFCSYRGICGFDEKIPGFSHRKLKNVEKDDILTSMKEEVQ